MRGKGSNSRAFVSPDLQLEESRKYVKAHLDGYVLDEESSLRHMDIDKSASRLKWQKRDGLVAHLEAARNGEYDALVFFKLSRFARNAKEGLELFELFGDAGCSLHSVMEPMINTKGPAGKLMTTILLAVAEMEADNISEWVTAAFLRRVEQGMVHGKPPFWISKNEDGNFCLNDREPDIRRLVDLRLEGRSYADVARTLNREGLRTRAGELWTFGMVKYYMHPDKILLLQGHFVYGVDKDDEDEKRIIVRDAYPAVIGAYEAEAMVALNRRNAELYGDGNPRRAGGTTYPLSGIIWCSQCGNRLRSRNSDRAWEEWREEAEAQLYLRNLRDQ